MNKHPTTTTPLSSARDEWWKKTIVRRAAHFVEQDVAHVQRHAPYLQEQQQRKQQQQQHGTDRIALLDRSEIKTGRVLGQGGFSIVLQVIDIVLDPQVQAQTTESQRAARIAIQHAVRSKQLSLALKHLHADKVLMAPNNNNNKKRTSPPPTCTTSNTAGTIATTTTASSATNTKQQQQQQQYAAECTNHFCHAAADLAIEATYMSALTLENSYHNDDDDDDSTIIHHQIPTPPHIVPCRGLPIQGIAAWNSGKHDAFFILMDAVVETLDYRIQHVWNKQEQDLHHTNESSLLLLQQQKMQHAMELARALEYLHERRIVFRDLKPHNIGFNASNQLQLFDFGLCRELPPTTTTTTTTSSSSSSMLEETYEMSGVGTRRYMAVEIINTGWYNCKADVYSWAMVVWEMFSLEKPFKLYSTEDHRLYVCQGGQRPECNNNNNNNSTGMKWPKALSNLLQQAWCEELHERVTIKEALSLLTAIHKAQQYNLYCIDAPLSPHGVIDHDDIHNEDDDDDDDEMMLLDDIPPFGKDRVAFLELPPHLLQSLTTVTTPEDEDEVALDMEKELFLCSMNDCSIIMSEASSIDSLSNFSLLDFTMTVPEGVEVIAASSSSSSSSSSIGDRLDQEVDENDRATHCVTPPLHEITVIPHFLRAL